MGVPSGTKHGSTYRDKTSSLSGRTLTPSQRTAPPTALSSSSMLTRRSPTAGEAANNGFTYGANVEIRRESHTDKAYIWAIETIAPGTKLTVHYGPDY